MTVRCVPSRTTLALPNVCTGTQSPAEAASSATPMTGLVMAAVSVTVWAAERYTSRLARIVALALKLMGATPR
mgnify:CR=1 FL=1